MDPNVWAYLVGALLGILASLYIYYKQAGAPKFNIKYLLRVIPDLIIIWGELMALIEVADIPQALFAAAFAGLFFGWQADLIFKKITDLFPGGG